jgi:hypothetical protein
MMMKLTSYLYYLPAALTILFGCDHDPKEPQTTPSYKLIPAEKFLFNSFVDCNMAEAWIGDTFRIFPGKYGEDPVWGGFSNELKFADGSQAEQAFSRTAGEFTEPGMPLNAPPEEAGLHGAVWFETLFQDKKDPSGKTLYAVYHNENYPVTLPYDEESGRGYLEADWPQGLTGPESPAAVCRIGIMKSIDGGLSWENRGIFIEDLQSRMVLKPHNTSITFAGGVGDPSAVQSGDFLYLFYGEYGYPGTYAKETWDSITEWRGQCISVARIAISDLDQPEGRARRWNGKEFNAPYDSIGQPVISLQIPLEEGGGAASVADMKFHWGPSVSWNSYLECWVMLMAKAEGPSWKGSSLYISFNMNQDLGEGNNSQEWSRPALLLDRPGHTLWYPSLQPQNTKEDITNRNTSVKLGKAARLFFKDIHDENGEYISEFLVVFEK